MSTVIAPTPEELLLQRLLEQGAEPLPIAGLSDELKERLELEISIALDAIEDPAVVGVVRTIFREILTVFDRLSLIESNLHKLDTLLENLSILEVLQFEIRYLVEFIEATAMNTEGVSDRLRDMFDGMSYGISHDIKRVFERELIGEIREQTTPVVYGKILHAQGLLTNCFQQTTIALLQSLNPSLDPNQVFNDFEERQEQSLLLCNDLTSLMRTIKQAESQRTPDMLQTVMQRVIEFRDGSMQYLMYRDWRGYEQHALRLVSSIENNLDSTDLLHQFGCFLEVLYGHVKMRAVLRGIFGSSDNEAPVA